MQARNNTGNGSLIFKGIFYLVFKCSQNEHTHSDFHLDFSDITLY